MEIRTPYLDAIQVIPGATPGEKHKWMAELIRERISECNSLEEVVETEKIPRSLAPLMQIQAAQMLNKKDPKDQSAYGAIAEALKTDDATVVQKALQTSSFFDGSNTTITNVQYFFDNLFPYVSLKTRTLIIKALAIRLAPRQPELAAEFFNAVASTFGLEQALPLLPACSETFMYSTILERRIILTRKLVKTIFRKNPDFVVRYLRLSKPVSDLVRNPHQVNIYHFTDFLGQLIKKRLEAFVELYEMHERVPSRMNLSNKCAEALLKKGWDYFQRKPKLYLNLVPLRMINATRMEAIYPKLFPEDARVCKIDNMLEYLKYYPQDKKLELFLKTYQEVYGQSVLEDSGKVTVNLLRMLPAEERIRQARMKLKQGWRAGKMDYSNTGRCYLPVQETIPQIKDEIAKSPEMEIRAALLCQMIYCCRVNNDDQALLETLVHLRDRHKNEQPLFLMKVFRCLLDSYILPQLNENHWAVLIDIILRANVKAELLLSDDVSRKMIEAAIDYRLKHNQPIDQFIGIFVDLRSLRSESHWNILRYNPAYERTCLEASLAVVSQKYNSDKSHWRENKVSILCDLISSIYNFNEKHVNRNTRVERMSVQNYPWLLKELETIASSTEYSTFYAVDNCRQVLQKHEKDLYERIFQEKKELISCIESGEALATLRKTPEKILAKWEEYLKACQDNWYRVSVRRFVRTSRWYKDIPVKFAQQCLQDLSREKKGSCLDILASLIHGSTLAEIIEPLIPMNKTINVHEQEAKTAYDLTHNIITSAKIANPPIPLKHIGRLCEGDYLSVALTALISVCRRTALMDVVSFARTLASQRVSVRKHGIRIMHMVAPRDQLFDFLLTQWKTEDHYSIRDVLLSKAKDMFCAETNPATWSLFREMLFSLATHDESSISNLFQVIPSIPNEYIVDYFKLLLETIDRLMEAGLALDKVNNNITSFLLSIDAAVCNILPEEFTDIILRRFLFHPEIKISRAAGTFVRFAYLLPTEEKLDSRLQTFNSIFVDVVKNGWNVSHPQKSHYYPVNHMVQTFIDDLVHSILSTEADSGRSNRLMDGIMKAFLIVLSPQMDPTSYLLLALAKEQVFVATPKEFGVRIGQKMPELTAIFSPLFIPFMSSILQSLLNVYLLTSKFGSYDSESIKLDVMEGLIEVGSMESAMMAVNLLTRVVRRENMDRYDRLLMKFAAYDHPVIKSTLSDLINKRSYEDCPFDV